MYRTMQTDPDFRRDPKTNCFCGLCQRDISPATDELWFASELDRTPEIIHPDDLEKAIEEIRVRRSPHLHGTVVQMDRVGPECARKIKGFSFGKERHAQIERALAAT